MRKSDFALLLSAFVLILTALAGCNNTTNTLCPQDFIGTWNAASHHLVVRADGTADFIHLRSGRETDVTEGKIRVEGNRVIISENLGLFFDSSSLSIDSRPVTDSTDGETVMVLGGIKFTKQQAG